MGCEKNYLTPEPLDHTSGGQKRMNGKRPAESRTYAPVSMQE
jgi:hypothetical protein